MSETVFLTLIVSISALLFGAVEEWAIAAVGITVSLYCLIWLHKNRDIFRRNTISGFFYITVVAGFLYTILQVVPLPAGLVEAVSFNSFYLSDVFSTKGFRTISLYPHSSLFEISKIAIYFIVFFISASCATRRERYRELFVYLLVFTALLSVFAIIQANTFNGKIYWFRELTMGGTPFGPFVNRNHFAGFVGMMIPVGLALALEYRVKEKRLLLIFLTIITTLGLFYSLSRGGIISFLVSITVLCILIILKGLRRGISLYIALFVALVLAYLLYLGISPIIDRFVTQGLTLKERLSIWQSTLNAIKDFPVFGTGLGTYRYIIPMYYEGVLYKEIHYAHNDYLQCLLETGITGMMIFLLIVSGYLKTIIGYLKKHKGYLYLGLISSNFYIVIHSIVDFNLHIPSNAILFSVIAGTTYGIALRSSIQEGK